MGKLDQILASGQQTSTTTCAKCPAHAVAKVAVTIAEKKVRGRRKIENLHLCDSCASSTWVNALDALRSK